MPRSSNTDKDRIYKDIVLKNTKFLCLEERAFSRKADRELHERYISYLEFKYDQTDNPCYIWDAISVSYNRAINEFEIGSVGSVESLLILPCQERVKLRIKAESHMRNVPLSLPSWCISYLVTAASAISLSSDGLDQSKMPTNYHDDYLSRMSDWGQSPTLTNEQAAARLASMLNFTKQGWNAFDQRQSDRIALNLEQLFDCRTIAGVLPNKAYAAIAEELELEERALRRRIAHGRKLIYELESFLSGGIAKT